MNECMLLPGNGLARTRAQNTERATTHAPTDSVHSSHARERGAARAFAFSLSYASLYTARGGGPRCGIDPRWCSDIRCPMLMGCGCFAPRTSPYAAAACMRAVAAAKEYGASPWTTPARSALYIGCSADPTGM